MATHTSVDSLVARIGKIARNVQTAELHAVNAAALAAKTTILPFVAASSGGDLRLSGVGRRGAKVGVRYDIKGTTNPTALVRATGPLHFRESDTKAGPRPHKRRRRRSSIPETVYGHPGTKGVHPWARGKAAARPVIARAFHKSARTVLFR